MQPFENFPLYGTRFYICLCIICVELKSYPQTVFFIFIFVDFCMFVFLLGDHLVQTPSLLCTFSYDIANNKINNGVVDDVSELKWEWVCGMKTGNKIKGMSQHFY